MALTPEQYDLIVFLEQYYLTNSALPTREAAVQLGLDEMIYTSSIKDKVFRNALVERGIPVGAFDLDKDRSVQNWRDYALTEEQLTVANTMLDLNDNRSRRKKLSELGISTAKYASWERDPTYQAYLRSRSESLLGDSQSDAHLALVDRVRSGDMSAIKYFNELTGRHVPVGARASEGVFDTKMVLIKVVEIMQIHLSNQPEVLQAIANDLIELSEGPVRLNSNVTPIHKPQERQTNPAIASDPNKVAYRTPIVNSKVGEAL